MYPAPCLLLDPSSGNRVVFQVCREFLRGACKRAEADCRFAHPATETACAAAASEGGYVTLCMDHEKGRCARDPCRYYHRPTSSAAANSSSNSNSSNSVNATGDAGVGGAGSPTNSGGSTVIQCPDVFETL